MDPDPDLTALDLHSKLYYENTHNMKLKSFRKNNKYIETK